MSRRSVSLKPPGFNLAPGYAAISEISRRRRRPRKLRLAVLALTGALATLTTAAVWLVR